MTPLGTFSTTLLEESPMPLGGACCLASWPQAGVPRGRASMSQAYGDRKRIYVSFKSKQIETLPVSIIRGWRLSSENAGETLACLSSKRCRPPLQRAQKVQQILLL